jgi:hypothetical protein
VAADRPAAGGLAWALIHPGWTTEEQHWREKMFLRSLMAITDNRKRMAILTVLTFIALC